MTGMMKAYRHGTGSKMKTMTRELFLSFKSKSDTLNIHTQMKETTNPLMFPNGHKQDKIINLRTYIISKRYCESHLSAD